MNGIIQYVMLRVGLFSLIRMPLRTSLLLRILVFCSFLLINSVSWYGATTLCLTIHVLSGIFSTYSFRVLQIKLLWHTMYRLLWGYKFIISYYPRSVGDLLYSNVWLNFLRNWQDVFHSDSVIFYSHQQRVRDWVFSHLSIIGCCHCF